MNLKFLILVVPAVFISLLIGFAIGRRQLYAIQNSGEAKLARAVMERFRSPNYHLLNHVTLQLEDGTTQIDHILVSRFGVFVIETKDYSGWIFANAKDRVWTQVFYSAKFKFQNPLQQNFRHLCAVRELLDFLGPEVIHPVVVFTGTASFKTEVPDGVFSLNEFLNYVARNSTEVMSVNRIQFCIGRLEATRLAITRVTDVEHVLELRRRFGLDT